MFDPFDPCSDADGVSRPGERAEHGAGASRRNSLLQGRDGSALNQGQQLQSPGCAQELPSLPKRAFLPHKYSTNVFGHWQLI